MEYDVIRSARNSISIQIKKDGSLVVCAPYFVSDKKIQMLLDKKSSLIRKKLSQMQELSPAPVITKHEMENLRRKAKEHILPRVKFWSERTGLSYTDVKITSAKSRFGSCNSNRSLCFSLFLMLAGETEIDYVILHELCHTKVMNHSASFYDLVSAYMPDYKIRQKKLKELIIPNVLDEKG